MMKRLLLLFCAVPLLIFSCDPDENNNGTVKLNVKALYDGEPLVMLDKVYTYPDGSPFKFQLFNFYLSDVTLKKAGETNGQQISEVAVIDYGDIYDVATAEAGIDVISEQNIAPGTYSQLEMGLGISPALNATQPGDYSAGHPLTDNFWSWAKGYVFVKIEAIADLDGDGAFTDKLTYHIGEDELYTLLTLNKEVTVVEGATSDVILMVDLYEVLEKNGEFVDITIDANTQDHTNDEAVYGLLWDNLTTAFSIE